MTMKMKLPEVVENILDQRLNDTMEWIGEEVDNENWIAVIEYAEEIMDLERFLMQFGKKGK